MKRPKVGKFKGFKCLTIISVLLGILLNSAHAQGVYTPPRGSPQRKAIVDALRQGLKHFPEKNGLGFQYKRLDFKSYCDVNHVTFIVKYLKVKNNWAWIEARGEKCLIAIDALLFKEKDRWEIKGMVIPDDVVCQDNNECIDIKTYLYKRLVQMFPSVPSEIFPEEKADRRLILEVVRRSIKTVEEGYLIFKVEYFNSKNDWAWIETSPRSTDGLSQFEPVNALLYKEKGQWTIKQIQPCCGDCANDPECADMKRYYKKLMRMFPNIPSDIFPK